MTTVAPTPATSPAPGFEPGRPYLFAVAYRLLGSAAAAEDVVVASRAEPPPPPASPVRHGAGADRLAPFRPWSDRSGRSWQGWRRLPRAAPFVLGYLAVSWTPFLPMARPAPGNVVIDTGRVDRFLYHIPDLTRDFPRALFSLATAPWLNHNLVQLVYVTVLLLGVGLAVEAREGTRRTIGLFFGTTFAGAVFAGLLLHAIYPEVWDNRFLAHAWERTWSGGSAGCFGLLGALAARARVPWPLLALVVLWEVNLVYWYLREFTSAFHLSALLVGFLVARYLLPARAGPAG